MKDTELHAKVLRLFYDRRAGISFCPKDTDFDPPIPLETLFRVCGQLGDKSLVDWKPTMMRGMVIQGLGKITTHGTEEVERGDGVEDIAHAAGTALGHSIAETFLALEGVVYALSKQPNFDKAAFLEAIKFVHAQTPPEKSSARTFFELLIEGLPKA
jgi:hypothetical protein